MSAGRRHVPTTRLLIVGGHVAGGVARCACGWVGPTRTSEDYTAETRADEAGHRAATKTTAAGRLPANRPTTRSSA